MMKRQWTIFLTAIMFYTRIPCPKNIDHNPDDINKATRYFPLVGWVVGGIAFTAFWLSTLVVGIPVSVVIALLAGVLTTGAFHEDGLADTCDGFGGGWTRQQIVAIMKDSRIGAFGTIALVLLFLLKYTLLCELLTLQARHSLPQTALLFVTYHALSRWAAVHLVFTSSYAKEEEDSKAKPIAKTHGPREMVGAYLFGLLPLATLCTTNWHYAWTLLPLLVLCWFAKRYFEKWIGGYTGDGLGAVEQIAECLCILSLIVVWKFT